MIRRETKNAKKNFLYFFAPLASSSLERLFQLLYVDYSNVHRHRKKNNKFVINLQKSLVLPQTYNYNYQSINLLLHPWIKNNSLF